MPRPGCAGHRPGDSQGEPDRAAAAAAQHNAHTLRTPKHKGHYHYGRRCGRHSPCISMQLLFNTTRARARAQPPEHTRARLPAGPRLDPRNGNVNAFETESETDIGNCAVLLTVCCDLCAGTSPLPGPEATACARSVLCAMCYVPRHGFKLPTPFLFWSSDIPARALVHARSATASREQTVQRTSRYAAIRSAAA